MVVVHALRPDELSAGDRAAWQAACAAQPAYDSPLLLPQFAEAVASVRDDVRVLVKVVDGRPVVFLPHHRRGDGLARPVGAPFSDYHAAVAAPGVQENLAELLAEGDLAAFRCAGLIDPAGLAPGVTFGGEAFRMALDPADPEAGVAYMEARRSASAKRFKNWRRLHHKLERDHGELRLQAPDPEHAVLDRLLGWKRAQLRDSGLTDVLRPAWTTRLFHGLLDRRDEDFSGLLVSLWAGDRLVSGQFGVRSRDVFHPWIAATDPELAEYSPGQAFLSQMALAMPRLALRVTDLGQGHEHYKRPFASEARIVGQGLAVAASARGRRAAAGEGAWSLADAAVGGRPLFSRLRRRLDVIASVELSLGGRLRGVADLMSGASKRLSADRDAA